MSFMNKLARVAGKATSVVVNNYIPTAAKATAKAAVITAKAAQAAAKEAREGYLEAKTSEPETKAKVTIDITDL